MDIETKLAEKICQYYLSSSDFNGLPVGRIDFDEDDLAPAVVNLIRSGTVDLVRGDGHPNPHIKAVAAEPTSVQIEKISKHGLVGCLYPTEKTLHERGAGDSVEAPFTKELKLGAPQLDFRVFDLRMLEWYRNDPRYEYAVDDIHGTINQKSRTERPDGTLLVDRLEYLKFGFAYNDEMERGVAVFLRYLHDLPEDQQKQLAQFQISGSYELHPDFYRTQIIGEFPERVSIYDAFLEEKNIINGMCKKIGKPSLFRSEAKAYQRPRGFGILIRPTRKEFGDFSLLLDQLLSDDLNREFFKGDISISETLTREDGSTLTQSIGTINLLEKWIRQYFKPAEPRDLDKIFKNIRTVRAERQRPAHKADDNDFDQKYVKQQRELIGKAFVVVRFIRMILENHPNVKGHEVPDWLREGRVWNY